MATETTARRREMELVRVIQADQTNPVLTFMLELAGLLETQAVQALVSCSPEDFRGLQGRAQAFRDLRRKLNERTREISDGNS